MRLKPKSVKWENQDTSSGELADVEDAMAFAAMGLTVLLVGLVTFTAFTLLTGQGWSFDRLQEIANAIDIPLVLHGGSGIPREQVQKQFQWGLQR